VAINPTPTPESPVGTTVEVPARTAGGTVSITQSESTSPAPSGYSFSGQQVVIEAPVASWDNPLRLVFALDATAVPQGQDHNTIDIFRNGVLVEECAGLETALPPASGSPDGRPCVSQRQALASGDVQITVLTPRASQWNFGAPTDGTPPTVAITSPSADATYLLGQVVTASYTCSDPGPGASGLESCAGPVPAGDGIDTGSVGAKTLTVVATDHAGNRSEARVTYRVVYAFSASAGPLATAGTVQVVIAGKDVSVPFSLQGNQGLDVFMAGSPSSVQVPCPSPGTPRTVLKQNADGKTSSLRYLPETATYEYEWVTSKAWAGTCREFTMTLRDGTVHTAVFEFR